jgi:phosphate transport system permease protein
MKKATDLLITAWAWMSSLATLAAVVLLLAFLIKRGLGALDSRLFFGSTPWMDGVSGAKPVFDGIWPAFVGTFFLVALSSAMSIPVGIASGVYLAEYSSRRLRSFLGFAVDVLSGTPSIVMGLFGYTMILLLRKALVPQARTCLFLSAVCVALLILPYVIRTTQTALEAIPEHLRLLGPGVGLTRWQNIRYVLLPLASKGILSGVILAIGRACEDTAVILLTGVVASAGLPHSFWDKFEALPFRIYYLAAEHRSAAELDQGFGTALVLLLLTGSLFLVAFFLHGRFEKRWRTL